MTKQTTSILITGHPVKRDIPSIHHLLASEEEARRAMIGEGIVNIA